MKRGTFAYVGMVGMMAMLVGWGVGQAWQRIPHSIRQKFEQLTASKAS